MKFQDISSDGARGIQAGVREAELAIPLFIRDGHRVTRYLEEAYRCIRIAERAKREEQKSQASERPRGRRMKVKVSRPEAEAQENQA